LQRTGDAIAVAVLVVVEEVVVLLRTTSTRIMIVMTDIIRDSPLLSVMSVQIERERESRRHYNKINGGQSIGLCVFGTNVKTVKLYYCV